MLKAASGSKLPRLRALSGASMVDVGRLPLLLLVGATLGASYELIETNYGDECTKLSYTCAEFEVSDGKGFWSPTPSDLASEMTKQAGLMSSLKNSKKSS